jgi:hypothetical protein
MTPVLTTPFPYHFDDNQIPTTALNLVQLVGAGKETFRVVCCLERKPGQKNAGLKAVTLIATLNPVSQVLW